ncbi:hypothetical protein [Tenacibaculum piscium]|uniref:hypothetical protein n=1 Tax=Tenacibaculum piscium TaxID=1458515 RepID=UPI001F3D3749|nr:hypothetical protein [Tenacibaculum piscium]
MKKIKKGAQTNASIGARGFCYKENFKLNSRHAKFISASHQQENYGKSGCEPELNSG